MVWGLRFRSKEDNIFGGADEQVRGPPTWSHEWLASLMMSSGLVWQRLRQSEYAPDTSFIVTLRPHELKWQLAMVTHA